MESEGKEPPHPGAAAGSAGGLCPLPAPASAALLLLLVCCLLWQAPASTLPAEPCGPGSGGAGEARGAGNGEQGGKWRSRRLAGRMGHAGPAGKGRKDTARSEIWRVGWERQERAERAGSGKHGQSGMQRWEPQCRPRLGLWESCGCLLPLAPGWGIWRTWCPAPFLEQAGDAGRVAQQQRIPQEPGSQLECGWSTSRKNREEVAVSAVSLSVPRIYSR